MMNTQEESKPTPELAEDKDNIFSQPWKDSDVVLAVGDKEFHVHRFILSFQSPVFKAMFNGNFKDATQDRIELKDENYEAMLLFLKLLYPSNMHDDAEVDIYDENILKILKVADKYGARNVIRQCTREIRQLEPENMIRVLPYAVRHELPLEKIFDAVNHYVSTEKLKELEPELDNDRVYAETLMRKCRYLENLAMRLVEVHVWPESRRITRSDEEIHDFNIRTLEFSVSVENCRQSETGN